MVSSGGTPSRKNPAFWGGEIPWVTTSKVDFNTITDADEFITAEGLKNSAAKLFPAGTLLVALYGQGKTRGKVAMLGFETTTNQACAAISIFANISPSYLLHFLISRYDAIRNSSNSGGQENLNGQIVKDFPVILPPIREQIAIATALSDVDTLLAKLGQLITKKRNLKQAAMQQLLTGKTRLPGFTGEWTSKTIKEVTRTPVTDGPHMTPKFLADGIPFLSVNNLVNNKIDFENVRYVSRSDHEIFSRKCKPQRHDLLLGKAASVGKIAIVQSDVEFNIWSPIALIRLNDSAAPLFVYYCMQGQSVLSQITILTNSSSQGNIGMGDIEQLELLLPTVDEQNAIAKFLSDMDAELTTLEARREKTHALKQGMMQELLTGRTRLV